MGIPGIEPAASRSKVRVPSDLTTGAQESPEGALGVYKKSVEKVPFSITDSRKR